MRHISSVVLAGILALLICSMASATVFETESGIITDDPYLHVTLVNQDPYPAEPGGYVDLLFKVENWGVEKAENVVVELMPEYPFSIYGADAIRELGTIECTQGDEDEGSSAYLVKYRVLVDRYAVDGENEIKLKYSYATSDGLQSTHVITTDVKVLDPKTDFEVVLQDISGNDATLAVANTGDNDAYAVVVSIPEQEGFRVSGILSNVIGTLDAGDYTLASFTVSPSTSTFGRGLLVEVAYTDMLGIRRTIQKEVEWPAVANPVSNTLSSAQPAPKAGALASGSNGLTYIMVGLAGIVGITLFLELQRRRRKR